MLKTLEHNEHASHMAHGNHAAEGHEVSPPGQHGDGHEPAHAAGARKLQGPQISALLVVVLAAALALTEQGAKHSEIKVQANLIAAADAWSQYQAKSTRGTMSLDISRVLQAMDPPATPEVAEERKRIADMLALEQDRFERDPADGKAAIMKRARAFEEQRDYTLEQTHSYHNGAAALELGIVLATASTIIGSRMLILVALGTGFIGLLCGVAGMYLPSWGAF